MFISLNVPEQDATEAATVLLYADTHGIDSHGVGRLMTYVELLRADKVNTKPQVTITRQRKSAATVDGDNGLGLVVGPKANRMAFEMAQDFGTGWVSVCNSNHFGAAGFYVAPNRTTTRYDRLGHDQLIEASSPALGSRTHVRYQSYRFRGYRPTSNPRSS